MLDTITAVTNYKNDYKNMNNLILSKGTLSVSSNPCDISSATTLSFSSNPCVYDSIIPKNTKTLIDKNFKKGIRIISNGVWGLNYISNVIVPHIKDIHIIKDKVVIVIFSDGSKEKAVLDDADTFSLEQGISICITKKMLSMQTGGNGSSAYNKLIDHCLKVYKNNRKAEEKAKAEEQAAKEKEKKATDKARAKKIKKANKNREREIEIQKEAYLRAMREFNNNSAVEA